MVSNHDQAPQETVVTVYMNYVGPGDDIDANPHPQIHRIEGMEITTTGSAQDPAIRSGILEQAMLRDMAHRKVSSYVMDMAHALIKARRARDLERLPYLLGNREVSNPLEIASLTIWDGHRMSYGKLVAGPPYPMLAEHRFMHMLGELSWKLVFRESQGGYYTLDSPGPDELIEAIGMEDDMEILDIFVGAKAYR